MHTVTFTSLKVYLKSQMKITAQEALLYLLQGKNGYVKLKFGKYNYGLQTHTNTAVTTALNIYVITCISVITENHKKCEFTEILPAVMASVAHLSTLSTTVKRTSQTTSATLEDVLIDMYVPVQVNEHVSLQQSTSKGEASG